MNLADPAIRVEGLVKRYRSTTALDGLDCEVPSGAITGLLGPNGAGKTTLFRSLLGLTRTDAGRIQVLDREIPGGLVEVTKKIGAIIEEPGLIKALTGRVNLQVAADQLGFGHDRIEELLDFVALSADAGRKIDEYSKGMRQRLALAAALIGDPELLLLDEPLDGLDPAGQMAFRARLREIADSGQTVVVSSHDLADIEALADYVVVLNHGRLVTEGPLEEMLSGGATRVVTDSPVGAGAVLTAAGIGVRSDGGALIVDENDGSTVVRLLAEASIYPSEVRPARSTLESVFLGMTGEEDL
jgi:ABC-type multidrug transport system ATPase subunit